MNIYVCVKSLSRVRLFATPWMVTYQAPRSVGFSRQEYWSGLPFPSPGDLPNPGIEPGSPALEADTFNLLATRDEGESCNTVLTKCVWLIFSAQRLQRSSHVFL